MLHASHSFFQPQILAVVGASDRYGSIGRSIFSQLRADCAAQLIPINPKHKSIGGLPAYENLSDAAAEQDIDTAVLIVAAEKINGIMREAIKNGVRQIVIVNETENPSNHIRRQFSKAAENAHKANVMLTILRANSVANLFTQPTISGMAYIGQSNDVADCMKYEAHDEGLAFSRFLVCSDTLNSAKLIEHLASESSTTALLVHIHTLNHAHEWFSVLNAVARQKPVVVLLTLNHHEENSLFEQALTRCHILFTRTLADFFMVAKLLHTRLRARGKRLAIISNTPQIATLVLQTLPQYQLQLAQPPVAATRALYRLLPSKPESRNPVFLPADASPSLFQAALQQQINDDSNDAILLLYGGHHPQDAHHTARLITQMQTQTHKPLLLVWLGMAYTNEVRQLFQNHQTLHFRQPERALHALFQLNFYREHRRNSHPISAFHDYCPNTVIVQNLHETLRPILPMTTLPASRHAINRLLAALQLSRSRQNPISALTLQWSWQNHFGQTLTLIHQNQHITLLPPFNPEIMAQALTQLMLPETIWQNYLLNIADVLHKLPEIQYLQLLISHENNKWLCHACKLNLHEPDKTQHNLFAPYPHDEAQLTLPNGKQAILRPIRAEDAILLRRHIENLESNSRKMRFMMQSEAPPPSLLSRLSRLDYRREYALILHDLHNHPLAFAHYTADIGRPSCEFGISIADELQGQGIGQSLMQRLIQHAKQQGFQYMRAEILIENIAMQKLASKLGFNITPHSTDKTIVQAELPLSQFHIQAA